MKENSCPCLVTFVFVYFTFSLSLRIYHTYQARNKINSTLGNRVPVNGLFILFISCLIGMVLSLGPFNFYLWAGCVATERQPSIATHQPKEI